jgi:hypothetical protein
MELALVAAANRTIEGGSPLAEPLKWAEEYAEPVDPHVLLRERVERVAGGGRVWGGSRQ